MTLRAIFIEILVHYFYCQYFLLSNVFLAFSQIKYCSNIDSIDGMLFGQNISQIEVFAESMIRVESFHDQHDIWGLQKTF